MWINGLGLFALASVALPAVHAFKDTSPFFLFSTHETPFVSRQLESAHTLSSSLSSSLKSCSAAAYILISQPGVHARDYSTGYAAPQLRHRVLKLDGEVKGSFVVSEVVGRVDVDELQGILEEGCGVEADRIDGSAGIAPQAYTKTPLVVRVDFAGVATDLNRSEQLVKNDKFLNALIDRLPSRDYTVLYTTTPREATPAGIQIEEEPALYEMMDEDIFQNPLQMNMKRDSRAHSLLHRDGNGEAEGDSKDDIDEQLRNLPLFEKYQFLSPGIFMGLMISLLIVVIIYFGISAMLSLKVSYVAFEKDNGPAAVKKQQ
ncbi:vacuolar ATP synthase subunit S1 [Histoplasma capsulatum var. duboisii H88]|uniref:Protein BIG1 n=1 Tax=Ajellomyces capsulatus (strain H88) TaxID=544711 RepID=A0A8A1LCG1_AJEC8|nr:vacuolar ATP synthase subunit S1 [Histoplasma capsulatum var. duboisii H88]